MNANADDGPAANKEIVRRFFEEGINAWRPDLLESLIAPDFRPSGGRDRAAYINGLHALKRGFSNLHFTIDALVAESDLVAVRWTIEGVNDGNLFGYPPTGRRARHGGMAMFRVSPNGIVDAWPGNDRLRMLEDLGRAPPPPPG